MPSSPPPDRPPALETVHDLTALELDWSALWRRCPAASPFEAPEWLLPWTRHHAPGRAGALALRTGGRLVGVLPLFRWGGAVLLAGTGPSDRADILLEPGTAPPPDLLAAAAAAFAAPGDRIDLQQLPPASPLLAAPDPPGWRSTTEPGEPCHVAPLHGEDGLAALSPRRRANWRYAVRRVAQKGGTVGLVPPAETGPAIADLLALHARRWGAKGEPGVLADPLLRATLLEAAPALAAAGLLRLHELRFGPRRAALLLVLAGARSHAYYIGGFDPDFARLSPSAVLIGAAMRAAHDEGATSFDFLRGREPYKRDWGAVEAPTWRRLLRQTP